MAHWDTMVRVDDAYGRVTNPQRYGVLHDEALGLVGRLTGGRRPWLLHDFTGSDGRGYGRTRLDVHQARALGAPARIVWRPWTTRG